MRSVKGCLPSVMILIGCLVGDLRPFAEISSSACIFFFIYLHISFFCSTFAAAKVSMTFPLAPRALQSGDILYHLTAFIDALYLAPLNLVSSLNTVKA